MLRVIAKRVSSVARSAYITRAASTGSQVPQAPDAHSHETEEAFNQRFEVFFNKSDIDHWEVRAGMNELAGMDLVPEPTIVCAALRACRRLNDYALAVRFLECVKDKCGDQVSTIYPYILQEIKPTLDELGVNTPEELGYDKPELALTSVYDIH